MFWLQFVIFLLPAIVTSAPFNSKAGPKLIRRDTRHGRSCSVSRARFHTSSPLAFLNSPFAKRDHSIPERTLFQGMPGMVSRGHKDEEALRRKIWEAKIRKEKTRSHPEQVMPLGQDEMNRSRCDALPFVQDIFRDNCAKLQVPNKFCFGQCNSFYVPGWPVEILQLCASCAPVRTRRISVPLQCHGGRLSWEEVVLVEECSCETRRDVDIGSGEGFLPAA